MEHKNHHGLTGLVPNEPRTYAEMLSEASANRKRQEKRRYTIPDREYKPIIDYYRVWYPSVGWVLHKGSL